MRSIIFSLALLLATVQSAHADVYDFSFNGTFSNGVATMPNDFHILVDTSLLLPQSSPFYQYCAYYATSCIIAPGPEYPYGFSGGPTRTDYLLFQDNEIDVFYEDFPGGPSYPYNTIIDIWQSAPFSGPFPLFTGSPSNPVISTGTFFYLTEDYNGEASGPVTITDTSNPSAVPEPSTFVLLGTGALSLAATLRRR